MDVFAVYGGLFAVAFAAATILPAQSEAALAGLLATGSFSPAVLVGVASIGNVLGSAVNWGLVEGSNASGTGHGFRCVLRCSTAQRTGIAVTVDGRSC